MDLLCITPYYDYYLIKEIMSLNSKTKFASISFHLDTTYFKSNGIKNDPGLFDIVSKLGIRQKKIRQILKLGEYLANLITYTIRLLIKKPDVIHIQWLNLLTKTRLEIHLLKLLKLRGIKIIYTVHNILPHDTNDRYKKVYSKVYKEVADNLICHTDHAKKELISNINVETEKIKVIPHGPMFNLNIEYDNVESKKNIGINSDEVVVLFFGIIRPYKGIEFLLDTWKKVSDERKNVKLIIAGNGDEKYLNSLRNIISQAGLKNIKTNFEYIPTEMLPIYHNAADILVYPYKNITQSGALLTGMSFNKPIIATDIDGFKDVLRDRYNAYTVKYGDIENFKTALINLIDNPETRKSIAENAYKDVNTKYSWKQIGIKTLDCYKKSI
ncbi:glycosyltransferase [Chengkuizengella sp. YPA3-1-1]|uniref:Glycosyltransferase n=1 Tax=Chengkuizengella marina TaxID=2507566 RepID=A0A6N9Q3Q9_9BACL|nr:glycosyltransferase [Chengkuizengella marina]